MIEKLGDGFGVCPSFINQNEGMKTTKRRKIMDDNIHLMSGMRFINGIPCLDAYNGSVAFSHVAYHDRTKHEGKGEALHFFLDDYRFRDAVWYNLQRMTESIKKFDFVFAPDLSLWRNMPTEFFNIKNIFRSRFVAAYWQLNGMKVIPVASWGGLDSFAYCFEGLPKNSVIGISAMGVKKSNLTFARWLYGLRRLEEEKNPSLILIYGDPVDLNGLSTPVIFMESFISNRFRNGRKENGRTGERTLGRRYGLV